MNASATYGKKTRVGGCGYEMIIVLSPTLEQANHRIFREAWLQKENSIKGVFRSKIFVEHTALLEKYFYWYINVALNESILNYNVE